MSYPVITSRPWFIDPITAGYIAQQKADAEKKKTAKRKQHQEECVKIQEISNKKVKYSDIVQTEFKLRNRLDWLESDALVSMTLVPTVNSPEVKALRHEFSLLIPQGIVDKIIHEFFTRVEPLSDEEGDEDESLFHFDAHSLLSRTTSVY
jgi:hypothetical protein